MKKRYTALALAILILGVWWIMTPEGENPLDVEIEGIAKKDVDQFPNVKEPHWNHMPITYSYGSGCVGPIIPRIEWAFEDISNRTNNLINFKKIDHGADIEFICHKNLKTETLIYQDSTLYTFSSILPEVKENIIHSSIIEFWGVTETSRPESCLFYPKLEAQAILFSFNFDNSDESEIYSIMSKDSEECRGRDSEITRNGKTFIPKDQIDDEIIDCLKYLYSDGKFNGTCLDINFIGNSLIQNKEESFFNLQNFEEQYGIEVEFFMENNFGIAKLNLVGSVVDSKTDDEKSDFEWEYMEPLFEEVSQRIDADNYKVIYTMTSGEFVFNMEYSLPRSKLNTLYEIEFFDYLEIEVN